MSNFNCKICNYITKEKSNINRHMKSKKHLQKINMDTNKNNMNKNKIIDISQDSPKLPNAPKFSSNPYKTTEICTIKKNFVCNFCGNNFDRMCNLTRHKKICAQKNNEVSELKLKLMQYEKDMERYKDNAHHYIEEVNHYKEETNYYKQMLREAGGLVKKSVSSLTYIVDNYNNAPALQTISIDDIKTLEDNEKKLIEDILSSYKHKTLSKYLGNFIIALYKKDDPKSQSIWNTDDSRLTYLIKEIFSNKSSNWIIDKKGIKTTEYLIDPFLLHIKKLLISYQKNLVIPDLTHNSTEMEFILYNSKKIIELMNDIDDGIVSKEILKYISCHLRFDGKLIKKAIE